MCLRLGRGSRFGLTFLAVSVNLCYNNKKSLKKKALHRDKKILDSAGLGRRYEIIDI